MAYLSKQLRHFESATRPAVARRLGARRTKNPDRGFLPDANNISHMVAQIETGFPFRVLDTFQQSSGLPLETIATLIRLPARTLSRRRAAGRLKPEESDRLLRISRIVDQATALFEGDKLAAMQWLQTPQPGLSDQQPLAFARTEIGARAVEDLIGGLEHGVFT
jgi:putative toxin-antitoxin system antitoxin component (TIGR02293 family)